MAAARKPTATKPAARKPPEKKKPGAATDATRSRARKPRAKKPRPRKPPVRDWAPAFLASLETRPDVSFACRMAGIVRSTAYRRQQADEEFALAWHDAINVSLDKLEAALFRRATEDDTRAAMFLLKAHRPDIYGDRFQVQHQGELKHRVDAASVLAVDAREQVQQLLESVAGAREDNGGAT